MYLIPWKDEGGFEMGKSAKGVEEEDASVVNSETLKLTQEIESLKFEISNLKSKFNRKSGDLIAVGEDSFSGKAEYSLKSEHDFNELIIDMSETIDVITLLCTVPLTLLSHDSQAFNLIQHPSNASFPFIMTLNPTKKCKRIKIPLRNQEGVSGYLDVMVSSRTNKTVARSFRVDIKALSLHRRAFAESFEHDLESLSSVFISGNFTKQLITSWLCRCLGDVPRSRSANEVMSNTWQSCFTNLFVCCNWSKGSCKIWSDNITALMVIKNTIAKLATDHTISVQTQTKVEHSSIDSCLNILLPKLKQYKEIQHQHTLLGALKEIEIQEGSIESLTEQNRKILKNSGDIEGKIDHMPRDVDFVNSMIMRLVKDFCLFRGKNLDKSSVDTLRTLLGKVEIQEIMRFCSSI